MSQLKTGTAVKVLRPKAFEGKTGEVRFYLPRLSDEQGQPYYEVHIPDTRPLQLPAAALEVL